MSDNPSAEAPDLGPAVDVPAGADAVRQHDEETADTALADPSDDPTVETPDDLGGTGGPQAGGAG
jgi:hypothetical protein